MAATATHVFNRRSRTAGAASTRIRGTPNQQPGGAPSVHVLTRCGNPGSGAPPDLPDGISQENGGQCVRTGQESYDDEKTDNLELALIPEMPGLVEEL